MYEEKRKTEKDLYNSHFKLKKTYIINVPHCTEILLILRIKSFLNGRSVDISSLLEKSFYKENNRTKQNKPTTPLQNMPLTLVTAYSNEDIESTAGV